MTLTIILTILAVLWLVYESVRQLWGWYIRRRHDRMRLSREQRWERGWIDGNGL